MMTGALAATTQERNRKSAAAARALDHARDLYERVTGALGIARKEKKTLRIIELEPEAVQAADALALAAREYKAVTGIDAPLSTGPRVTTPGTVAALRAANPEFAKLDDLVASHEKEINLLRPQVAALTKTLATQGALPVFSTSDSDPGSEAVLDSIYPERRAIRANNVQGVQSAIHKSVQLQTNLAELKEQLAKVMDEWTAVRTRRDAMFAEFQAQGRQ